ncbi:uncharacterized protein Dwil_GK19344 [Drosophila willistoni]|uniref:Sperm microtubule inner protein 1 C-terminal domain-containing protein n=1 Tax=Drosophila willistoni TaxID=7260 RepID=B4MP18_DROWI|nr:uncharacterized protein LOC6639756 [Drosophila willistoni]EDW73857.1 uncharacterized protein Dwil_GK19344 [Drosophila willistoni]
MFSSLNTQVSSKFQNARRQSVGTKDVANKTSQWRNKAIIPVGPRPMPKGVEITSTSRTATPLVKPRQRPNESKKITQAESIHMRCSGGKAKSKPIVNALPLLKAQRSSNITMDKTRLGGHSLGLGTYVLSHRRIIRPSSSAIFDYDLSQVEQNNFRHCQCRDPPMKSVPHDELQLLRSGQRTTYLEQRYDRTPDVRYNYPQATSWRYGWFHRQTQSKIGDPL